MIYFSFILFCSSMYGITISEKMESFTKNDTTLNQELDNKLTLFNTTLADKQEELLALYQQAYEAHSQRDTTALPRIHQAILELKEEIRVMYVLWQKDLAQHSLAEKYALWNQSDLTVSQLIAEFGVHEYLYIIPPDIATMHINLLSNLPIPRESWSECLDIVLHYLGIGIHHTHPWIKELYLLNRDFRFSTMITRIEEMELLPETTTICYILEPSTPSFKKSWAFLQRFANPTMTLLHQVGNRIFMIGPVQAIKDALKLYHFADLDKENTDYQLISSSRFTAKEIVILLQGVLEHVKVDHGEEGELQIIELMKDAVFITGTHQQVAYAAQLIKDVEDQLQEPQKKILYWYTTKYSDAKELAETLRKIYALLSTSPMGTSSNELIKSAQYHAGGDADSSSLSHFIVDEKTGCILMVVEQDYLPQLKEVLHKIDIPKKMVLIEVLLFEKKSSLQSRFGINLLHVGRKLPHSQPSSFYKGLLEFIIKQPHPVSFIPSFDLTYHFLLGQEDVQINAAPSITTVNQTPAKIAIVEEISINTGSSIKEKTTFQNSYTRAQYGITLQITPMINYNEDELQQYITLDTDIVFDTTSKEQTERPNVTRRHITNHVRIADGETVILGGLRRKNTENKQESLPFLGEIPGFGKLFSSTESMEGSSEMFIFITPKILQDPIENNAKTRQEQLKQRQGDLPELTLALSQAKEHRRYRMFSGTMNALFGHPTLQEFSHSGYDGQR